jgi:hypothetical protein
LKDADDSSRLCRMFKKAFQRGRSDARSRDPLQRKKQRVPKKSQALTGTHCRASCNGWTRTKLEAFFNILLMAVLRIAPREPAKPAGAL